MEDRRRPMVEGRADSGQDEPRWAWNEDLREAFRLATRELQLNRPDERVTAKAS